MESSFPQTIVTLMKTIKAPPSEMGREMAWARFYQLYRPAMVRFAAQKGGGENTEDIVQKVSAKLEKVIVEGQYDASKGGFHSYLATMLYNEVHMQHRRDVSRKADRHVSLDSAPGESHGDSRLLSDRLADAAALMDDEDAGAADLSGVLRAGSGSSAHLADEWEMAVASAAIDKIVNDPKSTLPLQTRRIYRAYVLEGRTPADVAAEFNTTPNNVCQIKVRVEKLIVAEGKKMAKAEINLRLGRS
ncbi:MAG: sigma-70 family RNA polymerase sigma factor [Kiritimatiellae bacterium]|nr:sigma-70 family RNA polymerase sigma factor [Kiritimatiellia bacterium]